MSTATANNQQIQTKGGKAAIIDLMEKSSARFAAVAVKHLTPEKLIKMVGVQLAKVPKLGECTPLSVLDCAMTCAELGLSPGVLGDAYLIPFRRNFKVGNDWRSETICTLIIGYRGMMKLARRSGEIATIQAEVVREGDAFHWRLGMDAALEHQPRADVSAPMTHAWALAKFKDGSYQFTVMRATEIESIRLRSKSKDDGPWKTDAAEMWKKTAIRRLCKMLPLTVEVEQAMANSDDAEFRGGGEDVRSVNVMGSALDIARAAATGSIHEAPIDGIASEIQEQVEQAEEAAESHEDERQDTPGREDIHEGIVETPQDAARKEEIKQQVEAAKPATLPICSPAKKGCVPDGSTMRVGGKPRWVCANHKDLFKPDAK